MTINNPFEVINNYRRSAPVDVAGLIRALGIKLKVARVAENVSGMIELDEDGKYLITINEDDSTTRQRFSMAHELGHYIYHRNKIGKGIADDRMYRSTDIGRYYNNSIGKAEETQANQFAANLLMPMDLIDSLKEKISPDTPDREIAKELAHRLEVSEQAMCIRLNIQYN